MDLYFILRDHFSIKEIAYRANMIFGDLFSEKLLRAQLSFFEDIDYTEPTDFIIKPLPEDEIKAFLIEKATEMF